MYNKHSVGNFGPFVSIADRAEALPEHAKRVSWVRSSDTRRRKPTNKGFSPKCASVMYRWLSDLSQQYPNYEDIFELIKTSGDL